MSQAEQSYLFFLKCPDRNKLLSFTAEVIDTNVKRKSLSIFHRRILKCRELLFSELELIAAPAVFSKTEIMVIVSKRKFYNAEFQKKLSKMDLRIIKTNDPLPIHLQECLRYTAIAKLAPHWNIVQDLLVQGRDFLMVTDPLRAIKLDIFVDDSEIVLSIIPKCIKLPPFRVETYSKLYDFSENNIITIRESIHVLPSLKKGKAVYLSKNILTKSPFKDYSEMKKHWKNMYGYRLPEISEENMWYLNVVFNVPFSTSYTYPFEVPMFLWYPFFCARPFGMTEIFRVDPQLTLQCFINDFCKRVHNICEERCQIMDRKASFPSFQLYRIDEIMKDSLPRPGTTYTKIQKFPFRSSLLSQNNNEKLVNNFVNSLSQTTSSHSSLFSENRVLKNPENCGNVPTVNSSCMTQKISYEENSLNKPVKNVAELSYNTNSNIVNKNLINLAKNSSSMSLISGDQKSSENCSEIQPKYAPKFVPKIPKKTLNSSLVSALQEKQNHETKPQEKYVPRFIPKQPKQNSQLITDITIHTSKLSLNKARKTSEPYGLNHKGKMDRKLDLKLTPTKVKNSTVVRKIKMPRKISDSTFVQEDKCSQDEARRDMQKNVNSRKRIKDELNSPKEIKIKKLKNNKKAKKITPEIK